MVDGFKHTESIMRVESAVSPQRRNRLILWLLGFVALSAWFAYDGWIGWPAANVEERTKSLPTGGAQAPRVDDRVTEDLGNKPADEVRTTLASDAPLDLGDQLRYDGPTGYLLVPKGSPAHAQWKPLRKGASEIWTQKILAVGMAGLALITAVKLVRAMNKRLWLDDGGLHTRQGQFIAWNRMTRLAADELAGKGWVDLEYDDAGRPARFRLDSYELAEFDTLVDVIC